MGPSRAGRVRHAVHRTVGVPSLPKPCLASPAQRGAAGAQRSRPLLGTASQAHLGRELDALGEHRQGRQQEEGHDGDDGEQVDVVQGALACGSEQAEGRGRGESGGLVPVAVCSWEQVDTVQGALAWRRGCEGRGVDGWLAGQSAGAATEQRGMLPSEPLPAVVGGGWTRGALGSAGRGPPRPARHAAPAGIAAQVPSCLHPAFCIERSSPAGTATQVPFATSPLIERGSPAHPPLVMNLLDSRTRSQTQLSNHTGEARHLSPAHPPLVMNFLDSTLRLWKVRLEPMAAGVARQRARGRAAGRGRRSAAGRPGRAAGGRRVTSAPPS